MLSINAECSNSTMHAFWNNQNLKPPVARKLAVGHASVRQLVFWLLVVSSNYFTKFHDYSMNTMIFPCMELFLVIFWWILISAISMSSKNRAKRPLSKRLKIGFQDQLSLNAGHSQKDRKLVFKTNYRLMQVKSIAECPNGSILQYFWPSLSYHLSLRSLFCLFLSGCLNFRGDNSQII